MTKWSAKGGARSSLHYGGETRDASGLKDFDLLLNEGRPGR